MKEKTVEKETGMKKYRLKLFLTGQTQHASNAISNLRRICEEELGKDYELIIIDVLEQPQLAEEEMILATPTLIKEYPPPIRRIIGDLSDTKQVLQGLGITHEKATAEER